MRIVAAEERIPRPLRWLAALGVLPIPGPLDELILVLVAVPLALFYRRPLAEAWRRAGASSLSAVEAGDPVVLTVVSGEQEAELVCGLLRSAGIECAYRDTEAIDSPLEEFTASGPREILVDAPDLEAAKELLAAQES